MEKESLNVVVMKRQDFSLEQNACCSEQAKTSFERDSFKS